MRLRDWILGRRPLSRLLLFSYWSFVFLVILFGVINNVLKFSIDSDNCIIRVIVPSIKTLVVFGRRLDLHPPLADHGVAEGLEQLQEVFEMMGVTFCDVFAGYVVEIVFDGLRDEVDDALDLLAGCEVRVFVDADELDDGLREDDLADVDIDMLAFQDFYLVDPPLNPNVLEHVYCQVYYMLSGSVSLALQLRLHQIITKIYQYQQYIPASSSLHLGLFKQTVSEITILIFSKRQRHYILNKY